MTLIRPDGRVVAESDARPGGLAGMESHADRPEVRAALAGGVGRDLRISSTLEAPLLSVASPARDGDRIVGVTTAAVIWVLAAIGSLIGAGRLQAAMIVTLLTLLVLVGVEGLERLLLRKSNSRGSGYFGVVDPE